MTKMDNKIGFEHKGIALALAHNRLVVPLNQREYSWEEQHVKDLFSDLASAMASTASSYFLGTVVLTKGDADFPEVSDGQQRLATTTILIAAIRDYFFNQNDSARANSVEDKYLSTVDLETTEQVPRLRLNVDDNSFFTDHIISKPKSKGRKTKPTKDSHHRLKRAFEIAHEHVASVVDPYKVTERAKVLVRLVKFLDDDAQVILLRVPDHLDAFLMFETLNDRGLRASQADLLKNHLLSLCNSRISEGQQKWATMLGVLESLGRDDIVVTYLHHVLITKFGPTREREVYAKIKNAINSQGKAIAFLDELAEDASDYAALFNSDHVKWNEYGAETRNNISTINVDLRVDQIRPLMFAVAKCFSVKEAKLAYRLFVFWSVRFMIAGGRGGLLDRNYSVCAQEVGNKTIKTAKDLTLKLMEILPTDAAFQAAFSEARISQSHLARYFLRAIEKYVNGNKQPEFVANDDTNAVNLEHILPENPGANWGSVPSDVAKANFKKIGNLVLLQAGTNSTIGNLDFSSKRTEFASSTFRLTKEVAKQSKWGPEEILARQKVLAAYAIKTWPMKI
jgi:uncharacterized protein with ParB-like and HNH nuclease domain